MKLLRIYSRVTHWLYVTVKGTHIVLWVAHCELEPLCKEHLICCWEPFYMLAARVIQGIHDFSGILFIYLLPWYRKHPVHAALFEILKKAHQELFSSQKKIKIKNGRKNCWLVISIFPKKWANPNGLWRNIQGCLPASKHIPIGSILLPASLKKCRN